MTATIPTAFAQGDKKDPLKDLKKIPPVWDHPDPDEPPNPIMADDLHGALSTAYAQPLSSIGATRTALHDVNGRLMRLRTRGSVFEEQSLRSSGGSSDIMDLGTPVSSQTSVGKNPVDGKNPISKEPLAPPPPPTLREMGLRLFAGGTYGQSDYDASLTWLEFKSESYAGSLGLEYDFDDELTFGIAGSYVESEADLHGASWTDLEGYQASAYVSYFKDEIWADALYSYGAYDHDIRRNAGFGDTAYGSPESSSHTLQFNTGLNMHYGSITHGPVASIEYIDGKVDPYRERGAGSRGFEFEGQDFEAFTGIVGWQVSAPFQTAAGTITPQLRVGYGYEDVSSDPVIGHIRGTKHRHEMENNGGFLSLGGGLSWQISARVALMADYEGRLLRNEAEEHYASLRIGVSF